MKKYLRKSLVILSLMILAFNLLACNKNNNSSMSSAKITPITESVDNSDIVKTESVDNGDIVKTESDLNPDSTLSYDNSKTLTENIDILNKSLETKYGKSLSVSTIEEYEKAGQADWTLVLDNNRIGIDIATWKFNYDSDSDEMKYMEAILSTFTFFCGEDMGNSLWKLTGDLLDGGADETIYGFEHDGSQIEYKNGNIVAYGPGNSESTMYIWLTPNEY